MNDDEPNTYLLDHDPAKLLPYSKRFVLEDPEVTTLPKAYQPNHPALFSENYS
jgi:hypothetical protein